MGEDLLWATKNGDLEQLKTLINSQNVNAEILQGNTKRSAIHVAADYGQLEVIKFLVSIGADINKPDEYGITPLLASIYEGHVECVKFLLLQGAKKDAKGPDGLSCLEAAESEEIKKLLS